MKSKIRVHHIYQSVQNWHLATGVGYNICIVLVLVSRQCISGQGKLVTVLAQITWNNCIPIMQKLKFTISESSEWVSAIGQPLGCLLYSWNDYVIHEQKGVFAHVLATWTVLALEEWLLTMCLLNSRAIRFSFNSKLNNRCFCYCTKMASRYKVL